MNEPKLISSVTNKDDANTACHEMEGMLSACRAMLGRQDMNGFHDIACTVQRQAELIRNWSRGEIMGTNGATAQAAPEPTKKAATKKAAAPAKKAAPKKGK